MMIHSTLRAARAPLHAAVHAAVHGPMRGPAGARAVGVAARGLAAGAADGVRLTERGAARLASLQEQKGNQELKLRLAVEGGGCSGFSYVFTVTDEAPTEEDSVFENDGKLLVVDETSLELVKGATVDFTEDLIRRSFEVVDNPNAESGCGCGSSFAAKMDDF